MLSRKSYLIGLVLAGMLIGCGGGGSSSDEGGESSAQQTQEHTQQANNQTDANNNDHGTADNTNNTNNTTTSAGNAKKFTADVMPILVNKCQRCHGSNGRFEVTNASGTYANISDLQSTVQAAAQYLLNKGSGTIGHGGGQVIAPSSMEYMTIKSWVDSGADFN